RGACEPGVACLEHGALGGRPMRATVADQDVPGSPREAVGHTTRVLGSATGAISPPDRHASSSGCTRMSRTVPSGPVSIEDATVAGVQLWETLVDGGKERDRVR